MITITPFLGLIIVYFASWFVLKPHFEAWNLRGFERFHDHWRQIFTGAGIISFLVSVYTYVAMIHSDQLVKHDAAGWITLTIGIMTFILCFVSYTDWFTRKAPDEMTSLGNYLFIPIAILGISLGNSKGVPPHLLPIIVSNIAADGWLQLGVWTALMVVLFVAAGNGMGWADTKILFMVGFALSWWIGADYMIWFMIIACLLQLLLAIPSHFFNWGAMKPRKKSLFNPKGMPRRALPFLPVLSFTFIVGSIVVIQFQ